MKEFSVLIVGGGSTYIPGIALMPLSHLDHFPLRSIKFYDSDVNRQKIVADTCEVLVHERNPEINFPATTDPETTFTGVDFVMTYIRARKYAMWGLDEEILMKYNVVGQKACGSGGIACGTCSADAMLELVGYMGKYSPQAWMLNHSNPAAIVAEATRKLRPGPRIFNICDMSIGAEYHMVGALHLDFRKDVDISYYGLNYSGWWTSIKGHAGNDLAPVLKEHIKEKGHCVEVQMYQHVDDNWTDTLRKAEGVHVLDPDTLLNTYLKYYFCPDCVVEHTGPTYTCTNQVMSGRGKLIFGEYRKIAEAQSSEGADLHIDEYISYTVDLVYVPTYSTKEKMLLIVKNSGTVRSFDPITMVGVPCLVGSDGPQTLYIGDIPRFQKESMEQQVAVGKLTVEAWAKQSYQKLWQTLTLSHMVPSASVAEAILDDLIEVNKDYWPELKQESETYVIDYRGEHLWLHMLMHTGVFSL